MNTKKMLLTTVATLTLVGYTATGLADEENGLAYGRSQAPAPLEGTWVVTIQPIVCSAKSSSSNRERSKCPGERSARDSSYPIFKAARTPRDGRHPSSASVHRPSPHAG